MLFPLLFPGLLELTFVLFTSSTVFCQPAITKFEVLPDKSDEGFSYLPNGEFAFFKCSMSGFDDNTMAVGWSFNGQIFADAALVDGMLNARPNIDEIFGFETSESSFTGFALARTGDEESTAYDAAMDLFIENWKFNGDYRCSICTRRPNGRCDDGMPLLAISEAYRLNVRYFPPVPFPQIESTPPAVGEETTVSCSTYPGYPTVDVTMFEIRGTQETQVSGEVTEPEVPAGLLFYNYTYVPTMDDGDIIYKCTIAGTESRSVELEPLQLVSIPVVKVSGLDKVTYNDSLKLTCTASSPTGHELAEYSWSSEPILGENRFTSSDGTFTVSSVQEGDIDTVIACRVVDSQGMAASDSYTINAVPPSDKLISEPPIAIIVVACIVGVILIILVILALYRCCWRKEKSEHKYNNHSANVTTSKSSYPDHKSMNGPYTISNSVASQQNSAPLPPYEASDYKVDGDYKSPMGQPVGEIDGYERQRSQDQFYPGDERSPDFHYNTAFDDGRQDYPEGYDGSRDYPDGYNDVQVGDFTQPTDRQPAYGQGYDDGYSDQRDPQGYEGHIYNDHIYNAPQDGYDDRAPYDTQIPYGGKDLPYDDNRAAPYDGNGAPYEESRPPYDTGAPYGDEYSGGNYAGDVPPRSPRDDGYNDAYYPPEQQGYPNQDGYNDPSVPYDDGYSQDQGGPYLKEDPGNYPHDYEPFGERDQVPDGQEADYQGDPFNESYNPPIIDDRPPSGGVPYSESYNPPVHDDRLPDGGVPSEDPFYDLYDMKPGSGGGGEFDDPQKYQPTATTPDRFDPSYV